MSKVYVKLLLGLFAMGISVLSFAQVSVTATAGTTGPTSYTTLKGAIDAINAGTHTGAVTVTISANVTETLTSQLSPSGTGTASYTSLTIKPAASTNPVVSGNLPNGILWASGNNITIDGSNNGSTTRNLTFNNTDTTGGNLGPISLFSTGTTVNSAVTVKNCIIKSGYYPILVAGISSTGLIPGYFSNLTIQNNQISRGDYGLAIVGGSATITGLNVAGNDINGTTTDRNYTIGIYAVGITNATITGNKIGNFEPTEQGDDKGIYVGSGSNNVTVDKNVISNIGFTGNQGYGGRGIEIASAATTSNIKVTNNMIANIYGDGYDYQATAAADQLDNPTAIMLTGTQTGITVAYNTIYLSGNTLNQPGAMSRGIYAAAGSTFSLQNNIIVNNLGNQATDGYGSVGVYLAGSANQLTSANFNDYYIGATGAGGKFVGQIGSTSYASLANWQAATSQEANSKNVLPVFVSATDLHLVPASNLALDNAGTPITGITTDIDGDTRSTVTPDIGADEFIGSTTDVTPPTITYTALGIACATTDRTLTVTITDASGVPTTGTLVPRIYYKKSTQSTYQSAAGTLNSGGTGTSGTWTFTISSSALGGVAAGDQIQYYVIAQDIATTPNISSSPAGVVATNVNTVTTAPGTLNSYTVGTALTGTVTVGTGGTYTTLTAAASAYNSGCLNGALTFSLTSATYGTGETFPITLSNPNGSTTNTLTIKPAAGITPTISGTSTSAMIWINGADYVTIDGSNTAGGTSRDLTVTTTGTSVIPLIWITSNGTSNGATNNTIKNVKLAGNVTTVAGVLSGGPTLGTNAEAPNSNNTISNNAITKVQNGLYVLGGAGTTYDVNWNINNNLLGATSAATDTLTFRGMYIGQAQNFTVNANTITGVRSSASSTSSVTGITIGGASNGGTISNNKIRNIHQINPTGYGANGIALSSTSTTANITVQNNMINDVVGYGFNDYTVADNGYGIMINNGAGYNLYYNTVNMDSSQTLAAGNSAALNIDNTVTTAGAIRLVDNILVNNQTSGSTARYAIINRSTAGSGVFASINYNDYYTAGANLGYSGSAAVSNLAALVTAFGGNANSINVKPVFVSPTDMHLTSANNGGINNHGTPVTGITTDIDGATRNVTVPDPGADEFDAPTAVVDVNDPDVVSMSLLPNIVNDRTTVRVVTRKAMSMQWNVVDATGKVVMTISRKLNAGRNDIEVEVSRLAAGYYQVIGVTEAGKAGAVNMIKQ